MIRKHTGNKTAIVTLRADRPGGVPTVVDWWYAFLTRWDYQPTVVYADDHANVNLGRLERLAYTICRWGAHVKPDEPYPTLVNAPIPMIGLFYVMPQWIWGPLLNRFDQHVFAGGPCHAAFPLAIKQLAYILWIGTLYEDELRGKVLSGDRWADRILQSPSWPILQWQERTALRHAQVILAQSPYTARRIKESFPDLADRIQVVMVPGKKPPAGDLQASCLIDSPFLLHVSRINDPRKNVPLLLRAFALISPEYSECRLVLAGDNPHPDLLTLCADLQIAGKVVFVGKVDEAELDRLYRDAIAFVLTSRQEGLGIVMLEAMARGTPVIATDCGGPEGIVSDGETGYIVPQDDVEALTQAMRRLLQAPDQVSRMGALCLRFVEENCSEAVVEKQLLSAFTRVFPADRLARGMSDTSEAPSAWRDIGAALIACVVFAGYLYRMWVIHWPAVYNRIIEPALQSFP